MPYAYYHRLTIWQKRIYRRSDAVVTVDVPAAGDLTPAALQIGVALKTGDPRETAMACRELLERLCARLGAPVPRVTVLRERPAGSFGELHGMYNPGDRISVPSITVWMRTSQRRQVVAFRTFLRTLLHELCHHLDYAVLGLEHSFHTSGFYKREASLYQQLIPESLRGRRRTEATAAVDAASASGAQRESAAATRH